MVRVVLEGKTQPGVEEIVRAELKDDKELLVRVINGKEYKYIVYMFEKFYLRINSELSVTVLYKEEKEDTKIELIASGGSVGLLSTSYGAEEKAVEDMTEKLVELGFTVIEKTN